MVTIRSDSTFPKCRFLVLAGQPKECSIPKKHRRNTRCQTKLLSAKTVTKNSSSPKVNRNSTKKRDFRMSLSAARIAGKQKKLSLIAEDLTTKPKLTNTETASTGAVSAIKPKNPKTGSHIYKTSPRYAAAP
jgi:hypothetical protein